jgi:glycine/D-amino acid oxidase-like deaminating enzyme
MKVVICGAGVIGACTAYFLSRRQVDVVVVERRGVACAASGKSGGFLALDWCDGSPLGPLARRSFALHAELAERFAGAWGYRRVDTFAVVASARRAGRAAERGLARPDWIGERALVRGRLGTPGTTAQVDPARFTRAMMDAAIAAGARLHLGCVEGVCSDKGKVTGVVVDGEALTADAVVIAMGPWSALARRWLPLPAVYGLKGNSIVLRTDAPLPAESLFVEMEAADGARDDPEVFPRPDGTTYVCGLSSEGPLPADPAEVYPDPGAGETLQALTRAFAPELGAARIETVQACYRPVTRDGLPLIGRVAGMGGAYVATGHSVWGMLNGPATGEALAELIVDGHARTVDLTPFDPARG